MAVYWAGPPIIGVSILSPTSAVMITEADDGEGKAMIFFLCVCWKIVRMLL